jgi:UDP-2,3-diacylglucosamine pyrophosphatase LpxH
MKKSIFVISDLHLGGKPGFQMCSASGRDRLARFIRYVADQQCADCDVHLVINGDIVDFLAEEKFAPFTDSDREAEDKLLNVIKGSNDVWESLKYLVAKKKRLTLLLGNHDIELSMPSPKRLLLNTLGPGYVEFIYDNQAFAEGPVLIEHGNSYDWWNVIPHGTLRHIRSVASRGITPKEAFDPPAGSQLVFRIMNYIKSQYSFVDLLKPEDGALMPFLAVLFPPIMGEIEPLYDAIYSAGTKKWEIDFDDEGVPVDPNNIAIPTDTTNKDGEMIQLARDLAYGGAQTDVSFRGYVKGFIELWRLAHSKDDKQKQLERLYDALNARAETTWKNFDVNKENEVYLKPATAAIEKRQYQVVVFGHTHLVKRVRLDPKAKLPTYLNTGTWADLMQVPEAIYTNKRTENLVQLEQFANDITSNNLKAWRKQIPTFARINVDSNMVTAADVFVFDDAKEPPPVPDGRLDFARWGKASPH